MTWAPGEPMLIRRSPDLRGRLVRSRGAPVASTCTGHQRSSTAMRCRPGGESITSKKVYPDDWEHIIYWLAYRVQRPEESRSTITFVISGHQDCVGKETLLQPAMQAVGPWNCSEVAPEDLWLVCQRLPKVSDPACRKRATWATSTSSNSMNA